MRKGMSFQKEIVGYDLQTSCSSLSVHEDPSHHKVGHQPSQNPGRETEKIYITSKQAV